MQIQPTTHKFDTSQVFGPYNANAGPMHFIAQPNGGSVEIWLQNGPNPNIDIQLFEVFNATTPSNQLSQHYEGSYRTFHVICEGGATFGWGGPLTQYNQIAKAFSDTVAPPEITVVAPTISLSQTSARIEVGTTGILASLSLDDGGDENSSVSVDGTALQVNGTNLALIDEAEQLDSGTYTITHENSAGTATAIFDLTVTIFLQLDSIDVGAEDQGVIPIQVNGYAAPGDTVYAVAVTAGSQAPTAANIIAGTAPTNFVFAANFPWDEAGDTDFNVPSGIDDTVDIYAVIDSPTNGTSAVRQSSAPITINTVPTTAVALTYLDGTTNRTNNGTPFPLDLSAVADGGSVIFLGGSTAAPGDTVTDVSVGNNNPQTTTLAVPVGGKAFLNGATSFVATGTVTAGDNIAGSNFLINADNGRWNGGVYYAPSGFVLHAVQTATGANPSITLDAPEGSIVLAVSSVMVNTDFAFSAGIAQVDGSGTGALTTRSVNWGSSAPITIADANYVVSVTASDNETSLVGIVLTPAA